MEIKTCEDYVVTRLMQLENEVEQLKEEKQILEKLTEDIKRVKDILDLEIRESSEGKEYLYVGNSYVYNCFSEREKQSYEFLVSFFDVKKYVEDE